MTWNGMKDDEELKEKVYVECELSALILAGDRKCLSNFRSFSNHTCRTCDLATKIELRINPPEALDKSIFEGLKNYKKPSSKFNKEEDSTSEESDIEEGTEEEIDEEGGEEKKYTIPPSVLKVPIHQPKETLVKYSDPVSFRFRGRLVPDVIELITRSTELSGEEYLLEIKGQTKGFREKETEDKSKRSLGWFLFESKLLAQINTKYYYEIMFRHPDEKICYKVRSAIEPLSVQPVVR